VTSAVFFAPAQMMRRLRETQIACWQFARDWYTGWYMESNNTLPAAEGEAYRSPQMEGRIKKLQDLPLPQRILMAAFITFVENGYDKASMDEVALVAGTTKRTVYAHFDNKEALFRAAIANAVRRFLSELPDLDHDGKLEPELVRFAEHFNALTTWRRSVLLQRVAVSEATRFPDLGAMLHRDVIEAAERRVAAFLQAAAPYRPEDPEALRLARLFLNMTTAPNRFATQMAATEPAPEHPAMSPAAAPDPWIIYAVRFFLKALLAK
jgi:AcrR family transcriptional regulator